MNIEQLLRDHGLMAVAIGVLIEGEAVLLIGGYLAQQGYFSLAAVMTAGVLGTFLGAEALFFVGRWKGDLGQNRSPAWKARADRVSGWLERFQSPFIFGYRFLYGFRTISPFIIGTTRVNALRFLVLNAAGSITWTGLLAVAGFEFGKVAQSWLDRIQHYEAWVIGGFVAIGVLIVVGFQIRQRRAIAALRQSPPPVDPPEDIK
jgi:membrane protein DedA with SNARE-associated domain